MSLDRIVALLDRANLSGSEAMTLRAVANKVAADTQPGVLHPVHGYGVVVGVTKDGELQVVFAREHWALVLPVDAVKAWVE
jgi:hypothetical protein